ncbi:hypothetical protein TorRG33x02_122120 [Trema orientale]|uniref:Uncharacterized protein n=1 Tax=Trema orientale TaxID=63057 RepID=A0A2P5F273_TREOI|nr:hypothetical protein TorRG33x02_122120 [Trema orientale]
MVAHEDNLTTRSNEAAKKLSSTRSALTKAKTNGATVAAQISVAKELLKEFEEKLEKGDKEIDCLQAECDKLEKTCDAVRAEHRNFAKQLEGKNKINEHINGRCGEAMAGIEQTKSMLYSLH